MGHFAELSRLEGVWRRVEPVDANHSSPPTLRAEPRPSTLFDSPRLVYENGFLTVRSKLWGNEYTPLILGYRNSLVPIFWRLPEKTPVMELPEPGSSDGGQSQCRKHQQSGATEATLPPVRLSPPSLLPAWFLASQARLSESVQE